MLGIGIDYALFVIARFREQLATSVEPREAARATVTTAGLAAAFAWLDRRSRIARVIRHRHPTDC